MKFQSDELQAAQLVDGELVKAEQALARAENAEGTLRALRNVEAALTEENGALNAVSVAKQQLQKPAAHDTALAQLLQRVEGARIELQDIADEAARQAEQVQMDPAEAARMDERVDTINRLLRKHRVKDEAELIVLREQLTARYGEIGSMADRIVALEREESASRKALLAFAETLSKARRKALAPLAEQVSTVVHDLDMPHAVFAFEHQATEPGPTGIDRIKACFSANADRAPEPLERVASGGEVSRVMLALLTLAAQSTGLPTIVFDEIDTGVSGGTADRVGDLMARMGKQRQVVAITHLPQIAHKQGTESSKTYHTKK